MEFRRFLPTDTLGRISLAASALMVPANVSDGYITKIAVRSPEEGIAYAAIFGIITTAILAVNYAASGNSGTYENQGGPWS